MMLPPAPQLPRVTRLMALAIKLQGQEPEHAHMSYQEMARLGHVSPSRLTQIMNLLHLAPDIQEQLLWLEPVKRGRDRIHEHALRRLTGIYDWSLQREVFQKLVLSTGADVRKKQGAHDV
jgi:hypothetical protein